MLVSSLCGYLPPAFPMSFFTDATGGYPGGVWYVTARPATKATVTALYLRVLAARRPPVHTTVQHCTYRNLCCTWYADNVPAWHSRMALLTEQARGGVRQV